MALADPIRIGQMEVKNRLVKAAVVENKAEETGGVSPQMVDLYRRAVRILVDLGWSQVYVLGLGQSAGFGDLDRQGCDSVHLGEGEHMAAGKTPAPSAITA